MSGHGQSDTERTRNCLDDQLSLALQRSDKSEMASTVSFSVPIPPGSALERGIASSGSAKIRPVNFNTAMQICTDIEKKARK